MNNNGTRRMIDAVGARCALVGLAVLAFASSAWMIIAFAVLHGLGWGTRGPLMVALRAE